MQVILLRNFLTLQENLDYLQCAITKKDLIPVKKKFKFEKVSSVSILKILRELKTNKATGVDNLAEKFLTDSPKALCTPMAQTCYLSIKITFFQNKWKVAKVKPLYKWGPKTDRKYFRRILLLRLVSKSIEQIVHDQTTNFLTVCYYHVTYAF